MAFITFDRHLKSALLSWKSDKSYSFLFFTMMYNTSFSSINKMPITLCLFGISHSACYNLFSTVWWLGTVKEQSRSQDSRYKEGGYKGWWLVLGILWSPGSHWILSDMRWCSTANGKKCQNCLSETFLPINLHFTNVLKISHCSWCEKSLPIFRFLRYWKRKRNSSNEMMLPNPGRRKLHFRSKWHAQQNW